jgi:2-succinyl-5-enolpyruvyl-6-hydroxy-3-cyclohexene-1-carboxylate synthase
MHGFVYHQAFSSASVVQEISRFFNTSEKPKILEIFTPSAENDLVLKTYFKYIQ